MPSRPPSNPKAFVTVFWQRFSWARLHSNFWTLFTRFFYTARSRNRPGSHEIMGIYGSNSRGVKEDRDLVTQPSFMETLCPAASLQGLEHRLPAPPLLFLATSVLPAPIRIPLSPRKGRPRCPPFVALQLSLDHRTGPPVLGLLTFRKYTPLLTPFAL